MLVDERYVLLFVADHVSEPARSNEPAFAPGLVNGDERYVTGTVPPVVQMANEIGVRLHVVEGHAVFSVGVGRVVEHVPHEVNVVGGRRAQFDHFESLTAGGFGKRQTPRTLYPRRLLSDWVEPS